MKRLTLALLSGAYLCLALIVALSLWRNGGGWGAGVAALVGGLGLAYAFHGLIERALDSKAIRAEIGSLREAQMLLVGQLERGRFAYPPTFQPLFPSKQFSAQKGAGCQDHRRTTDAAAIGEIDTDNALGIFRCETKRGSLAFDDRQIR